MIKKIIFYLIVLSCIRFTSCSWILGFYLINSSAEEINIEMKLQDSLRGTFAIFDYNDAAAYPLSKHSDFMYDKSFQIRYDTLNKFSNLIFKIPVNTAVQIGVLHNDTYKNHDQYFINGRVFNLEKIIIKKKTGNTTITYDSFDRFFQKGSNRVQYIIN